MPAISTITINDGKATPVAHAFSPVTTTGYSAKFAERNASIAAGYSTLNIELREPKSATGAFRLLSKMTRPVVQTVNGVDVVTQLNSGEVTLNFSQASSAADRKDLLVLMANMLLNASVGTVVTNLEPIY